MANEEKSVGSVGVLKNENGIVVSLQMPVRVSRLYYSFQDDKTGKTIQGEKLLFEADFCGETFRLAMIKDDQKLFGYFLKPYNLVLLDNEGRIVPDSAVSK